MGRIDSLLLHYAAEVAGAIPKCAWSQTKLIKTLWNRAAGCTTSYIWQPKGSIRCVSCLSM